jgi:hypothetical protein
VSFNYAGPDKIVGSILAQTPVPVVYWENVKSIDVQRAVNTTFVSIQNEQQEYIGFGNQSWKDVEVHADLYLYQFSPNTISDNTTLQNYLATIHTAINQYDPRLTQDMVAGYPIVWIKITGEERDDDVRGAILYSIVFEVRILLTTTPSSAGTATTTLTQLVLNFLSGLPNPSLNPPSNGPWQIQQASVQKANDLQRTGDIVVVHAPAISGHVIGIGEGQAFGQYTQQQISMNSIRLRLYAFQEADIVTATDWIAKQAPVYFLNVPLTNGISVLGKMESYGQILKERGVWMRDLELTVEVIFGI